MGSSIPAMMKAAVIDRFGGPEVFRLASIPVPALDGLEVLIRVESAGVGAWDPWLREGGSGLKQFPQVLGTDGAGIVVAVGPLVRRFKVGDRVYGFAYDNLKGGFYAEYAAISEGNAAAVPECLSMIEAGALAASGLTALAGLEKLKLKIGSSLIVLGASGGVGHVALQLAQIMATRVLAVGSRPDGVELVKRLGADAAADGRAAGLVKAARDFAPGGLDAAIAFAYSKSLAGALAALKKGGAIAYPNGVDPEPARPSGVKVYAFDGLPGREAFKRLNALISEGPFGVEISRTYAFEEAARAHRDILKHHTGKLAFKIGG